ncbi:MAG TPA: DUF4352 domain-containing protein [Candidatus Saccharimonadales bacterium]
MSKKEKDGNWFKRHKILTVILGIIAIAVIASAAGGGNKSKTNTASSNGSGVTTSKDKVATTAKLNETARDGKFEFVVKSVACGTTSVGGQYLNKTAQGQYCLATVSVKNIGDKQQYFSESDQKLLNASGQQYSPDTTATLYNSPNNSDVFLAQINPGNSVEGVLVYDIPKDQTPVTAELHDSSLSSGVKVNLQ